LFKVLQNQDTQKSFRPGAITPLTPGLERAILLLSRNSGNPMSFCLTCQ